MHILKEKMCEVNQRVIVVEEERSNTTRYVTELREENVRWSQLLQEQPRNNDIVESELSIETDEGADGDHDVFSDDTTSGDLQIPMIRFLPITWSEKWRYLEFYEVDLLRSNEVCFIWW